MSDLYSELLVKKERTMKDKLMKGGMIALVVIFGLAGILFMPLLLFVAIALGIVAYFVVIPGTDLEFEYLFVKGELVMVKINGEDKEIAGRNLLEYLNEAGFETERVVVEKNLEIIPKDQFGQVVIQDEDVIEVVRFVGGG